jgi:putative spermidine/putrescine transport system substrate-binding protein
MVSRFRMDSVLIAAERLRLGEIDRRQFLVALGAAGATMVAGSAIGRAAEKEVVICNWGGDAVKNFQAAFGDPFTKATGIKAVVVGEGPDDGKIRAMVEAKNVTWDVADTSIADSKSLGNAGYLEPIDYAVVDKNKVPPGDFAPKFGVANYFFSNVLAYDTTKVPKPPTSWADYFDTKGFPGKRSMCKWVQAQLEPALVADGVAADKIYPLDVDRAFKRVKAILPDLLFWESGAQSQQYFRDGEVVMGNIWHTRANLLRKETNGRIDWIWAGGLLQSSAWTVPKGNPAGHAVMDFIASSQSPEQQITLLKLMGNGPANPAADAMLTDDLRKISPTSAANMKQQILIDTEWYGKNVADLQNKFLDLIAS